MSKKLPFLLQHPVLVDLKAVVIKASDFNIASFGTVECHRLISIFRGGMCVMKQCVPLATKARTSLCTETSYANKPYQN
jgi:hypothetical protein